MLDALRRALRWWRTNPNLKEAPLSEPTRLRFKGDKR